MRVQRTLARSEDVAPLATDDPPDGLTVMARATNDLFDRHALLPEREDGRVCLLAPKISVILHLLGRRQERGIDEGGADDGTDLAHGLAHGVKESAAGILHQVPAVGDLDGLRQGPSHRLSVATATVTGDCMDQLLMAEPGFRCRRLPVRQQYDRSAAFEVADDCAVAVIAPPREVINADHAQRLARHPRTLPDHAQQRVVADRQHQPLREAGSRSAAQREPEVLDNLIETIRPAGSLREDAITKALGENLPAAEDFIAPEAADEDPEFNASAAERKVLCSPVIPALDLLRNRPTIRTRTGAAGGPSPEPGQQHDRLRS